MAAVLVAGLPGLQPGHTSPCPGVQAIYVPVPRRQLFMDAKWTPRRKSYTPGWLRSSGDVYGEQQSEYAEYAARLEAQQSDASSSELTSAPPTSTGAIKSCACQTHETKQELAHVNGCPNRPRRPRRPRQQAVVSASAARTRSASTARN